MNAPVSSPAAVTLDYEAVIVESPPPWKIGTLSYSKRGLAVLFGWLLWGDFAWNMKERAINPIAQLLLRRLTAPDWLVGLLIGSIPTAIGFFLSPFVSVKSDRYRSPWGRRIPFILIPTPFVVVMMIGLAFCPEIGDWFRQHLSPARSESACRIGAFAVFWTGLEIATIIANTLVGALINDVVPHTLIGRFFGLFRIVGLAAGVVFLNVKEGKYAPPPPPEDNAHGRLSPLISYFKECFSHPYYLWFFAATTLGNLAMAPINTFSVFHAHSVGMSNEAYGKCIALSWAISGLIAYQLGIFADRFHPIRMGILFAAMYSAATAFGFVYADTSSRFFVALLLHTVISGCYITATASIGQRMLPRSRFAELGSAAGIVGSLCFVAFPPALGFFIKFMNHQYRYVFIIASGLSGLTVLSYLMLLQYKRPNEITE
jgi:Na+/melibiose symporter-like transporter